VNVFDFFLCALLAFNNMNDSSHCYYQESVTIIQIIKTLFFTITITFTICLLQPAFIVGVVVMN
jgi:hypothetical protein